MTETVEILMHLHRETDRAVLVSDTGDEDDAEWLPKSQIEFEEHKGSIVRVTIPEWLATEKGLI